MKFLLLVLVVGIGLYLLLGRSRKPADPPKPAEPPVGGPTRMLACAHCGVHLPSDDAVRNDAGEVFCSAAHRLAGPR